MRLYFEPYEKWSIILHIFGITLVESRVNNNEAAPRSKWTFHQQTQFPFPFPRSLELCDISVFDKHTLNIGWYCTEQFHSEKTCMPYCKLKGEYLTDRVIYKCKVTPGYHGGKWQPAVPPTCERGCNFDELTKNKNVHSSCSRRGFANRKFCSVNCQGKFKTPPAKEYQCISTPKNPDGIWTPSVIPRCLTPKEMEQCDTSVFDKGSTNIGWHCMKSNYFEIECKPYCKTRGEHLTKPSAYKCKAIPGVHGGKWYPEIPPTCKKGCNFTELTKHKNVKSSCRRRGDFNRKVCTVSCQGKFKTPPAKEYQCVSTIESPDGIWTPNFVPRCLVPRACNFFKLVKGKKVNFNCSHRGFTNKTCTVSCKGKFKTPPADKYNCYVTPDHPGGIWMPSDVPRCILKDCDFRDLIQGKNVVWSCENRGFTNRTFCTVTCKGKFEAPPANEYQCISTPDKPEGTWTPDAVPRCLPLKCDFTELVDSKHVSWSCKKTGLFEISCTVTCKGNFETPAAEQYVCISSPYSSVVLWTPATVPRCLPPKDCNFHTLIKNKSIDFICRRQGINNKKVCTVSCKNEFETPAADEYTCIATPDNPAGIWTPNFVPRCIRKGCDFREMMQGKDVFYKCDRRGSINQNFCIVGCLGRFETPSADVYECTSSHDNPDGIWTPSFVPRCVPKDCDFWELVKDKNVTYFECGRLGYTGRSFCTVSCDGKFETPPEDAYECIVTPEHPFGMWTVSDVPRCISKASEDGIEEQVS